VINLFFYAIQKTILVICVVLVILGAFFLREKVLFPNKQDTNSLVSNEQSLSQGLLPTKALLSSFSETEIESWKTYDRPEWFFSLEYPSSLLQVTCPADPSCYFGSLELDPQRYYSISDLPANAIFIDIGSRGAEGGSVKTDLLEWKKTSGGLDPNARYQLVTIGDIEALKEIKTDQETIFVPTGTGRVLEFILLSVNPDHEKIFESMLSTISLKEFKKESSISPLSNE